MDDNELRRQKLDRARREAERRDSPAGLWPEIPDDIASLPDRVARLEKQAATSVLRIGGLVTIALISSAATLGLFLLLKLVAGI